MQSIQTTELRCKYGNATDVVKAGTRRLKCGLKPFYKCNGHPVFVILRVFCGHSPLLYILDFKPRRLKFGLKPLYRCNG